MSDPGPLAGQPPERDYCPSAAARLGAWLVPAAAAFLGGYVPSASFAAAVRRFQSGVVDDYVTWVVIGLACLGGVFILIFGLSGSTWCTGEFSGAVTLDPPLSGYAPGT